MTAGATGSDACSLWACVGAAVTSSWAPPLCSAVRQHLLALWLANSPEPVRRHRRLAHTECYAFASFVCLQACLQQAASVSDGPWPWQCGAGRHTSRVAIAQYTLKQQLREPALGAACHLPEDKQFSSVSQAREMARTRPVGPDMGVTWWHWRAHLW